MTQIYTMEPHILEKKPIKRKVDAENTEPNVKVKKMKEPVSEEKKPRKRKVDSVLDPFIVDSEPEVAEKKSKKAKPTKKEPETEVVVKPKKTKFKGIEFVEPVEQKTKTPKQIEAAEKRKQKALEKKAQEEALKAEIAAKEKELADKKAAQAEKRRLARQARKAREEVTAQVDEDNFKKEFKKHVVAVKKAEEAIAEPEHKADVGKEVVQKAKAVWGDPAYRNAIKDVVIDHNQKMREMIFPNRPLKL